MSSCVDFLFAITIIIIIIILDMLPYRIRQMRDTDIFTYLLPENIFRNGKKQIMDRYSLHIRLHQRAGFDEKIDQDRVKSEKYVKVSSTYRRSRSNKGLH